jgi:hypothetical protein
MSRKKEASHKSGQPNARQDATVMRMGTLQKWICTYDRHILLNKTTRQMLYCPNDSAAMYCPAISAVKYCLATSTAISGQQYCQVLPGHQHWQILPGQQYKIVLPRGKGCHPKPQYSTDR